MQVAGDVQAEREAEDLTIAERAAYFVRRVVLEDREMFLQDLGEGPVRYPLAVGETAAGPEQRLGLGLGEVSPELPHEARLPDTRVADDRDEHGPTARERPLEGGVELLELLLPAHERARQSADPARPHERQGADDLAAAHACCLPLRLDSGRLAELEGAACSRDRTLSGEDLAWSGGLLESSCNIDRIAAHERALRSRAADNDLSGVDADPQCQLVAERAREPALHRKRSMERALGVVLERLGRTERRHHGVPGELLDRPSGRFDLRGHRVVEALQARTGSLWILIARCRRRVDQIREENRGQLALGVLGHGAKSGREEAVSTLPGLVRHPLRPPAERPWRPSRAWKAGRGGDLACDARDPACAARSGRQLRGRQGLRRA